MKRAFTLVEVVLVVTISLVILSIGFGAYREARRNLLMDLEADRFVVLLHTQRDGAKQKQVCRGVDIKENAVRSFEMPFLKATRGVTLPCDITKAEYSPYYLPNGITTEWKGTIIFTPPFGGIIFQPQKNALEEITLSYEGEAPLRTISINNQSGAILKKPLQ